MGEPVGPHIDPRLALVDPDPAELVKHAETFGVEPAEIPMRRVVVVAFDDEVWFVVGVASRAATRQPE